jgi:hypothetical protein
MVGIIERKDDAAGAEFIELRVYRSPTNTDRILGQWQHTNGSRPVIEPRLQSQQSTLGTPVEIEFERVVAYSDACGIPFIWVNDPQGLFPSSNWPAI